MKIAIIGAGLSGLILYHYLHKEHELTLFDTGKGASKIKMALLHPYAGANVRLNWRGEEGYLATRSLLKEVGASFQENPILRLAITEKQKSAHEAALRDYKELQKLAEEETKKLFPQAAEAAGILVPKGIVVEMATYLQKLSVGAPIIREEIRSLTEVKEFDQIFITNGAASEKFLQRPLQSIKGQTVRLRPKNGFIPLPFPLIGEKHLVMDPDGETVWAGSTYERSFTDDQPNIERVREELLPKVVALLPSLEGAEIVEIQAGIRVFTPSKRPLAERIDEKTWAFVGLGSKGLLYHALIGYELASLFSKRQSSSKAF